MSTSRPFAYNIGATISGTEQIGNLSIGTPTDGFGTTGLEWWNGPDEELGYVICKPVPGDTQQTPVEGVFASVGFIRSADLTDSSFLEYVNSFFSQTFGTASDAKSWLNDNGYWTSYESALFVYNGKSMVNLSQIDGSANWKFASLNYGSTYNQAVTGIIDSGISTENHLYDVRIITNGGFMWVFRNDNDNTDWSIVFTDIIGNIIDTYSATVYDRDNNTLDGVWCYFIDRTNGVMKYFDGDNVYTYNFTPDADFDVDWNYDGSTFNLDGSHNFICKLVNGTASTYTAFNSAGHIDFKTFDNTLYYMEAYQYFRGDFIVLSKYEQSGGQYIDIEVWSGDGSELIASQILPSGIYGMDFNSYGENKSLMIFYNYVDINTDYYIINYHGDSQTLATSSHARGTNFESYNDLSRSLYSMEDAKYNTTGVVFFSAQLDYNQFRKFDYMDFVWFTDNNPSGYTYSYAADNASGDKLISMYNESIGSDSITIPISEDSVNVSFMTFGPTSGTPVIVPSGKLVSDSNQLQYSTMEIGTVWFLYNDYSDTSVDAFFIKNDGTIGSTQSVLAANTLGNYPYWDYTSTPYSFYTSAGTTSYYLNNSQQTFQPIEHYDNINNLSYDYMSADGLYESSLLLIDNSDSQPYPYRLINSDSASEVLYFPITTGNWEIEVGKNNFAYVYQDENSGNTIMNLYSSTGSLINTLDTGNTNWHNDFISAENRFYLSIYDGSNNQIYMTSEGGNNNGSPLTVSNIYRITFNDQEWYDNWC